MTMSAQFTQQMTSPLMEGDGRWQ